MAVVATPGRASGNAIRRKDIQREAPSTIAASSNDLGSSAKKAFMIQIANGRLNVRYAAIIPHVEPTRPVKRKMTNMGRITAAIGALRGGMIQKAKGSWLGNGEGASP